MTSEIVYTLKKNPRARHVKLKASVRDGLELVVPMRFNEKNIPAILEENKIWIEKELQRIQASLAVVSQQALPEEITLSAIDETWKISYQKTHHKKLQWIVRPHNELVLAGSIDNRELCIKMLKQWILDQAKKFLPDLLHYISVESQLPFQRVTIRSQETRWGSCSSDKNINLNYKLILIPWRLARHILIHELCHTVHLNHSKKFWQLVASLDEEWQQNKRDIRKCDEFIPPIFAAF